MVKRRKLKKIIDTSKQFKEPQRLPFHWAYLAYFGAALTCSLWQHGHPVLTLALLLILFPVGFLAYLPYKYISSNKRFAGQLLCIVSAIAWGVVRLQAKVPLDKVLVEGLCIISFCFILAQRRNDYNYLLFISVFLFLYGALLPRQVFIIAFSGAAVLCALLLYSTRLRSISSQLDLKSPARIISRNWPQYIFHIVMTLAAAYYIFSLLPIQQEEGEGLFETSFRTDNSSKLPPELRRWFGFSKIKKSPKGDINVKTGSPVNVGKSGMPIKMKKDRKMSVPGKGGSGTPGKQLIFRVKSPVKLYWVAQIYDVYNGTKWTFPGKGGYNNLKKISELNNRVTHYHVETKFIMEKWLGPKLYFAYRPAAVEILKGGFKLCNYRMSPFNIVLTEKKYPPLPCTYDVTTVLYIPSLNEGKRIACDWSDFWIDGLKPSHYLKLPRSRISRRTKRLVKRLVSHIRDPYKKALVLRDYLRSNFKYRQYARPVLKKRETVDYFLFNLKEGHCEYFASALTVMARLAGLPARVATGFSPGNYNALNKYFEVHEYHAHAWTQIFIPGMGWLTMDATPPGNVESRTTPFGIGSMRDPFGESWRVTPPEITSETINYIRNKHYEKLEADRKAGKFNSYEELFLAAAQAQHKAGEKIRDYLERLKSMKERGMENVSNIFMDIKRKFKGTMRAVNNFFEDSAEFCRRYWSIIIPVAMVIMAVIMEIMILKNYINRRCQLRKCRGLYSKAGVYCNTDPGLCVKTCYRMTRTLLNLAGLSRSRNMELLEYGRSLAIVDFELHKDVIVVFYMFYKMEYSLQPVSVKEANETLNRLENIRKYIYTFINENSEIEEKRDY